MCTSRRMEEMSKQTSEHLLVYESNIIRQVNHFVNDVILRFLCEIDPDFCRSSDSGEHSNNQWRYASLLLANPGEKILIRTQLLIKNEQIRFTFAIFYHSNFPMAESGRRRRSVENDNTHSNAVKKFRWRSFRRLSSFSFTLFILDYIMRRPRVKTGI
jgi:hypothetical protein